VKKLEPYIYHAQYVDNYDADTVRLIIDVGFNIKINEKFRLLGINAPEIKSADKEAAIAGRDYLKSLLEGKDLLVKTKKVQEKWGRWLCRIYVDDIDINAEMIKTGHAIEFMVDK
jgi:micrococcal nuclease